MAMEHTAASPLSPLTGEHHSSWSFARDDPGLLGLAESAGICLVGHWFISHSVLRFIRVVTYDEIFFSLRAGNLALHVFTTVSFSILPSVDT